MNNSVSNEIQAVYEQLINAWNNRDARGMADLYANDGVHIGFDGSKTLGSEELLLHVKPIFDNHPTPPFISKVKDVRFLSSDVAMLSAIAGMIPPQQSEINPQLNTHQTLITVKTNGKWQIQLFQNTPAQFHGRPELVEQMTDELRNLLK